MKKSAGKGASTPYRRVTGAYCHKKALVIGHLQQHNVSISTNDSWQVRYCF